MVRCPRVFIMFTFKFLYSRDIKKNKCNVASSLCLYCLSELVYQNITLLLFVLMYKINIEIPCKGLVMYTASNVPKYADLPY